MVDSGLVLLNFAICGLGCVSCGFVVVLVLVAFACGVCLGFCLVAVGCCRLV